MRTTTAPFRFATVALTVLLCAAPAAAALRDLAPADEYFGPLKESPVGITNRLRDAERGNPDCGYLSMLQKSLEDWHARYPRDTWIMSREKRLARLFERFHSPAGETAAQHAWRLVVAWGGQAEPATTAASGGGSMLSEQSSPDTH